MLFLRTPQTLLYKKNIWNGLKIWLVSVSKSYLKKAVEYIIEDCYFKLGNKNYKATKESKKMRELWPLHLSQIHALKMHVKTFVKIWVYNCETRRVSKVFETLNIWNLLIQCVVDTINILIFFIYLSQYVIYPNSSKRLF